MQIIFRIRPSGILSAQKIFYIRCSGRLYRIRLFCILSFSEHFYRIRLFCILLYFPVCCSFYRMFFYRAIHLLFCSLSRINRLILQELYLAMQIFLQLSDNMRSCRLPVHLQTMPKPKISWTFSFSFLSGNSYPETYLSFSVFLMWCRLRWGHPAALLFPVCNPPFFFSENNKLG